MKIVISKVENGYIVEITKFDLLEKRPVTEVFIEETLDDVVTRIRR